MPAVVDVPVTVVDENIPWPPEKVCAAATLVVRLASVVEPRVEEPETVRFVLLIDAAVVDAPRYAFPPK